MGQAGSDVAKEASDIVLTDDNFASILAAIEEGRRIFDNIQKFVLHVLAENVAQAGTLLVGLAFKDSTGLSVFPLAPVQVVWIIMATSGLPDMGLGFERAVPDILQRPPQSLKTGIFTMEFLVDMVVYGLWITLLCLSSFVLVVFGFGNGELGSGCNETYSASCELVFRARATTFACLICVDPSSACSPTRSATSRNGPSTCGVINSSFGLLSLALLRYSRSFIFPCSILSFSSMRLSTGNGALSSWRQGCSLSAWRRGNGGRGSSSVAGLAVRLVRLTRIWISRIGFSDDTTVPPLVTRRRRGKRRPSRGDRFGSLEVLYRCRLPPHIHSSTTTSSLGVVCTGSALQLDLDPTPSSLFQHHQVVFIMAYSTSGQK
jgi:hypothetical protein